MNKRALRRPLRIGTLLRLGRVSNLPTVWSNVLAGAVLGGADLTRAGSQSALLLAMAAMSALYIAGMYLNDAFDRAIDARERPTRPIPAGEIGAPAVFAIGFGLLGGGLALIARFGPTAALAGCALAITIVVYDSWHKANPASPLIMGLCRALVYLAAAAALGDGSRQLAVACGALAMFAHVVGLTYAAKQESLDRLGRLWPLAVLLLPFALLPCLALTPLPVPDPVGPLWPLALLALAALLAADALALRLLVTRAARGDVGKAVAQLIAASALVDAAAIALAVPVAGAPVTLVAVCCGAWALTRFLQRGIPGT